MQYLTPIRRFPGIGDYNILVDAINQLIDIVEKKKEVIPVSIEREVKDYSFFLWNEMELPYEADFIITSPEDAAEVFWAYALTYKETAEINNIIIKWNIAALHISVTEKVSEKEKKQEAVFETIETINVEEVKAKKKRGRPKKRNSWN